MADPGQNYDHLLDPISGYDGMHDLQYRGAVEAGEENHRGSLMTVNANGNVQPGMSTVNAMPMWAINASDDFDVAGGTAWGAGAQPLYRVDSGNIAGQTLAADNSTVLRRHIACFVATGGYELVTTEFNPSGVYHENLPLVSYTVVGGEATDSRPLGWVDVTALNAGETVPIDETIVGVVSKVNTAGNPGIMTEVYNQSVIQFWPVYLPARA
jgi:hypothetical protein